MKEPHAITKFPASRMGTVDVGRIANQRHHVSALLEIDVTAARAKVREYLRAGRKITFASWLIRRIACALEKDGEVNARRLGRRRKVSFAQATISVAVEKTVDGVLAPVPVVLRNAGAMSMEDISQALRAAGGPAADNGFAVNSGIAGRLQRLFYALPTRLRVAFMRAFLRNPFRANRVMGAAMFTSGGLAGNAPAWALPRTYHPVCFALGSIVKRPWAVNDRVEIREIAHLTITADHDVVDGAPLARFVHRLAASLEKAEGL